MNIDRGARLHLNIVTPSDEFGLVNHADHLVHGWLVGVLEILKGPLGVPIKIGLASLFSD